MAEITEKKTVDMLTTDSVSILTQRYIEENGKLLQVGENHRRAYVNSEIGRNDLVNEETEEVVNSVFSIWGDEPTIITEEIETN